MGHGRRLSDRCRVAHAPSPDLVLSLCHTKETAVEEVEEETKGKSHAEAPRMERIATRYL